MNEKFLNTIKNHWENPKTESLKDKNLQLIERASIIEQMKKLNVTKLADIGCGNCEDTIFFSKNAKIVDAFDYSLKMLDESKNLIKINNNKNINLARLNLIEDEVQNKYDTIITKRTLINLGNFNNQKDSILKIHNALTKNGFYIMLECSLDGLESMNSIRKSFSLDSIKMPYHNFHFNMNELLSFLNKYFEVSYKQYFSDYFYLTRIIGPLISKKTPYEHDNMFKKLSSFFLIEKQIGPQFLLLLKKK